MLVHVLVVYLQHVVVDVHDREWDFDPPDLELLELESGHRAGGVFYEDLVYGEVYLLP